MSIWIPINKCEVSMWRIYHETPPARQQIPQNRSRDRTKMHRASSNLRGQNGTTVGSTKLATDPRKLTNWYPQKRCLFWKWGNSGFIFTGIFRIYLLNFWGCTSSSSSLAQSISITDRWNLCVEIESLTHNVGFRWKPQPRKYKKTGTKMTQEDCNSPRSRVGWDWNMTKLLEMCIAPLESVAGITHIPHLYDGTISWKNPEVPRNVSASWCATYHYFLGHVKPTGSQPQG